MDVTNMQTSISAILGNVTEVAQEKTKFAVDLLTSAEPTKAVVDLVLEQVDIVKSSVEEQIDSNETLKGMKETVAPYAEMAVSQYNIAKEESHIFISARLSESKTPADASRLEKLKAIVLCTFFWIVAQLTHYYNMMVEHVIEVKGQISDEYVDGTIKFYTRWCALICLNIYESSMKFLPIDKEKFETRIGGLKADYIDEPLNKSSELVGDVITKGREVVDRYEPLKEAILERGSKVEALVKETLVGDILENTLSSLKNLKGSKRDNDSSDTVDASPSPELVQ